MASGDLGLGSINRSMLQQAITQASAKANAKEGKLSLGDIILEVRYLATEKKGQPLRATDAQIVEIFANVLPKLSENNRMLLSSAVCESGLKFDISETARGKFATVKNPSSAPKTPKSTLKVITFLRLLGFGAKKSFTELEAKIDKAKTLEELTAATQEVDKRTEVSLSDYEKLCKKIPLQRKKIQKETFNKWSTKILVAQEPADLYKIADEVAQDKDLSVADYEKLCKKITEKIAVSKPSPQSVGAAKTAGSKPSPQSVGAPKDTFHNLLDEIKGYNRSGMEALVQIAKDLENPSHKDYQKITPEQRIILILVACQQMSKISRDVLGHGTADEQKALNSHFHELLKTEAFTHFPPTTRSGLEELLAQSNAKLNELGVPIPAPPMPEEMPAAAEPPRGMSHRLSISGDSSPMLGTPETEPGPPDEITPEPPFMAAAEENWEAIADEALRNGTFSFPLPDVHGDKSPTVAAPPLPAETARDAPAPPHTAPVLRKDFQTKWSPTVGRGLDFTPPTPPSPAEQQHLDALEAGLNLGRNPDDLEQFLTDWIKATSTEPKPGLQLSEDIKDVQTILDFCKAQKGLPDKLKQATSTFVEEEKGRYVGEVAAREKQAEGALLRLGTKHAKDIHLFPTMATITLQDYEALKKAHPLPDPPPKGKK